ncbi:MAG TPA: hypothetical protein PL044_04380 [Clostridiales bacterium]|nr:hypothetical protein [Clostridiales bacterium]HQK72998.1 hypothetical protein [Clostridiales bacterium]
MAKAFGSGYFGEWVDGEQGVPAYRYAVDQLTDKKAVTMTTPAWNDRRNHTFVFGNDRVAVTASNFGYCQIRQDEGCPKYLTDYHPPSHQYGGGFGYLKGDSFLSTFYDGTPMLREYGAGYFKKRKENGEAAVEEILFAPYGDDPVVLKTVRIANKTDRKKSFSWFDYWAGEIYEFTFTHYCLAQLTFNTANVARFRRAFGRDFEKKYAVFESGVNRTMRYKGGNAFLRAGEAAAEWLFRRLSRRFYTVKNNAGTDKNPPAICLCALDKEPVRAHTDAGAFFGGGTASAPDYFTEKNRRAKGKNAMLTLQRQLELEPGESKTLSFAFIYEPAGFALDALREKYENEDIEKLFTDTLASFKTERTAFHLEGVEWLDRELTWHNACLRGSMTYASYFGTHILSQGGHYQYLIGLQGAPRDQLQHALPFIYTDPRIAREHILFTLREMSPEGELPYATHGDGMMVAAVMVPSDLQLMLLSFAGEYVLATRDVDFLNAKYTGPLDGHETERTVLEGLMLAYRYILEKVGRGRHGLVKMKTGDWNDQAVYGRVPATKIKYAQKHGESMLNSAMAAYSFRIFGEMLLAAGQAEAGAVSLAAADEMKAAVQAQWNGKWFKRAFLGEKLGWLGDDLLWLEPQPWAIIGGAADENMKKILAANIKALLCDINPNGAALISRNAEKQENSAGLNTGELENGGVWPAINGYLVWALAKIDGASAFEEFLKNSRAYQAEAYPDIWYGIWSGPDSVNSSYARYPGRTQNSRNPFTGRRERRFKLTVGVDWEDFPVLNLHAHTWQQYVVFKLVGLEFTADSVLFTPVIPKEKYTLTSRLVSFTKDGDTYDIRYNPLRAAELNVRFAAEDKIAETVTVNGEAVPFAQENGRLVFKIRSAENNIRIKLKAEKASVTRFPENRYDKP